MKMRAKLISTLICLTVLGAVPISYASNTAITVNEAFSERRHDDEPDGVRVRPALVVELLEWIGNHTNYDISTALAEPAKLSFCKANEEIRYEGRALMLDQRVVALYDSHERKICILRPWSSARVSNVSTLLHELVHDVQHLNKTWPCWGKAEWEAYKLQEQWLIEHGEHADFDWADILLRTRCRRDIHP